jgi:NADH-quinone oxidoreductase subunit F
MMVPTHTRVITAPAAMVGADLDAWFRNGGGSALRKATENPQEIISLLASADLRGMGGAGFPTARKWSMIAASEHPEKYVIVNGNEDEPGTFKDRFLLEHTPHQVIEGALIAAVATRSRHVIVYINPRDSGVVAAIREAIIRWKAHEIIAEVEHAIGASVTLQLSLSSGLYIGGEETAVVAWVEGHFPFPRRKPPFPAEQGVNGCPTLINNVETLAHIPNIVTEGARWYQNLGLGAANGTKLFSLSGDVVRPGLYELPMGTPLGELISEHGLGIKDGHGLKAVFAGGPSNPIVPGDAVSLALDFDTLRAHGYRLGTGAMIVVSDEYSIVEKAADFTKFFAGSSCGQCPSCKTGIEHVSMLLAKLTAGDGRRRDLDSLVELSRVLPRTGRCGLVDGAAIMLASSLREFAPDFERLIEAE